LELSDIPALDEEEVRIVTREQQDAADCDALRPETICPPLRSLLAAAIGIAEIAEGGSRAWPVQRHPDG
jgi:hypothetical protein